MKEQIIKILESYIVDNIGETSPKIDIDAIPAIADEIFALQLQQGGVIKSVCPKCKADDFDNIGKNCRCNKCNKRWKQTVL